MTADTKKIIRIFLFAMAIFYVSLAVIDKTVRDKIQKTKNNKISQAKREIIDDIFPAVKSYELDTGYFPTTSQGLAVLVSPPATEPISPKWMGPYLGKEAIMDPWGRPYLYEKKQLGEYQIRSEGARINDTDDDIVETEKISIGKYINGVEPDGFRGVAWGADIYTLAEKLFVEMHSAFPGFAYGHMDNIKTYIIENDDLNIDGIKADKIYYTFWNNKFYTVAICVNDSEKARLLKQFAIKTYGWGFDINEYNKYEKTKVATFLNSDIIWRGNVAMADFRPDYLVLASSEMYRVIQQRHPRKPENI